MMPQNTLNTSRKQVPRAMRIIEPYGTCLNYGCGKHYYMVDQTFSSVNWVHYDPYYQPVFELPPSQNYDIAYCCNVLNVIEHDAEVKQTIDNVMSYAAYAVFSVYEGDKTNSGKPTKCGYQRNESANCYKQWFGDYNVTQRGNIFEVSR